MYSKYTLAFVVSIAVVAWPLERAKAQEGLIGGIIGGVIGGAIANDQRRRAAPQRTVRTVPSSVQREQNREVQRALNHFGWNVGTADGVIGRNTRSGISQYQVFIGHAGTGQLTEFERNILTTAYQRAVIGGAQVSQTIATHDAGLRGLVLVVRDEFRGHATTASAGNYGLPAVVARAVDEIASSSDPTAAQLVERAGFVQLADLNGDGRTDYILDTSVTGSSFWCSAQACTVRVFVSTPDGYVRNDFQAFDVNPASFDCHRGACSLTEPGTAPAGRTQPGGVTEAAAGSGAASPDSGGVPDFFAAAADGPPPLGSQCNRIGLQTERNGGRVTLAAMTDPLFALSEQFCLVRAHSIASRPHQEPS
jgi:hypothetical protein